MKTTVKNTEEKTPTVRNCNGLFLLLKSKKENGKAFRKFDAKNNETMIYIEFVTPAFKSFNTISRRWNSFKERVSVHPYVSFSGDVCKSLPILK